MTVYGIFNNKNGGTYIGQTIRDVRKRLSVHKSDLKYNRHKNPHLQASWNKYGASYFDFEPLEDHGTQSECNSSEKWWIQYLKFLGAKVYNSRSGGDNRGPLSLETKRKLSLSQKGRPKSEEQRLRMSESNKGICPPPHVMEAARRACTGRIKSEEERAKIAESNKRRPITQAMRQAMKDRMSEYNKTRILTPEQRLKMSLANKGKTLSVETKEKISQSRKETMTKEHKLAISMAQKGKIVSQETRERQRQARLDWWSEREAA